MVIHFHSEYPQLLSHDWHRGHLVVADAAYLDMRKVLSVERVKLLYSLFVEFGRMMLGRMGYR